MSGQSDDAHNSQRFHYGTLIAAFVTKVYPVDPQDRRFYVDAVPTDMRGWIYRAPVFQMSGVKRNLRPGMTVLVAYPGGASQLPVVIAHCPNNETDTTYRDPLPGDPLGLFPSDLVGNPDDYVLHHDETGAWIRWRAVNSSAKGAAQDGGPCRLELGFRSGAMISLEEYNPPGYPQANPPKPPQGRSLPTPPAPPRAKFDIKMPAGFEVAYDEPEEGQSTLTLTHPKGTTFNIDADGNVTITTPATITVNAKDANLNVSDKTVVTCPDVELGADGGQRLAYWTDVENVWTWLKSHVHTDPQGGTTGVPTSEPPEPVGTERTKAL